MLAAIDFTGIAAVVTAVAVLASVLLQRKERSKTLHPMRDTLTQIDKAVNGKPPGGSTLVSQVQDLHDEQFPGEENGAAILPTLHRIEQCLAYLEERKRSDAE